MSQHFEAIAGARDRIVNTALVAVVGLGFVAFSASLLRSLSIGWQPVMTFQIVFWVIATGVAGFRHRLPFLVRAWFLIGMLLVLCLIGLVTIGLIGMSVAGLLMATVLATMLFGSRVGWVIAGVSLAMIAVVGVGASMGWISFEFDTAAYAAAPVSWALAVFASLMFIGICIVGISWIHEALTESLRILEEHQTEHSFLENQLRQAQKMEAIGQLTGGVAHDFNNVLAVILGNLELLRSKLEDNGSLDRYLTPLLEATKRGATLTHRLLAFARKQTLDVQDIDVGALLEGMDDMLQRSLGETIEIEVVKPSGLWVCAIDPGQLEQAVLNLAVNARDAMPDGGRLTIKTENTQINEIYAAEHVEVLPGEYGLLAVTDSGTGMTPEVQEKIFEPFFTTKGVGEGTGLGLSMVFGFVKQSGGHVSVYSKEGQGTTVRLYLPRSQATAAMPRTTVAAEVPPGKPGETILVVEDDENLRDLVEAMLEDLGYVVIVAGNGREALNVLSAALRVDLLLTDVVMPGGVSGPALAEAAHRDRAELKVLYMTGYAENALVHQGRLDHGVELLDKPFTIENLGRKLRAVLDGTGTQKTE